ncbi:MAG TPA: tyrosine--tRNA ligase, partial [bacterium]|nr:tyrosine--tRNA ligase [bacterium]
CVMQLGGDDQWSNMLAGIDLIRRVTTKEACAFTLPLITTASGKKMGKTEKGAVWLSADRTPVNEFYQYWRNTDDRDVERFLKFFTFVSLDNIAVYSGWRDRELNRAKSILAYRVTELVHGAAAAQAALRFERQQFEMPDGDWQAVCTECGVDAAAAASGAPAELNVITISAAELATGKPLVKLLVEHKICPSLSEARRLIQGKGIVLNGEPVTDIALVLTTAHLPGGSAELARGKKQKFTIRTA